MSTSSIDTVIPALQTLLQARVGLSGVSITEGPAQPSEMERAELIQILATDGEQSVRALNRTTQPREEEYDLNVIISVVGQTRDDQATLRARAFVLLGEIETQLRSDPHLGLSNVYAGIVGKCRYEPRANDMQRESSIDFDIHVQARL